MIPSPFWFEGKLTPEDYQKLGKLSLRWSHIDHLIANCLKKLLRLTDDEARLVVFPLSTDIRLARMRDLQELNPLPTQAAKQAFDELDRVTKAQVFETEELTNYAAHAALVLRHELGDKDPAGAPGPLPARPQIPVFLKKLILGHD